jgi:integrase/recombinase XerD
MLSPPMLVNWDVAVAAYLANRRTYGRTYRKEEHVLGRVRAYLAQMTASDLDEPLFDRWRAQFYKHSASTRVTYERVVYNFCRHRRRSEPDCFLPDWASLARQKPYALPTIIEPEQVARLLQYVSGLPPGTRSPLRSEVMRLPLVLLYTTGLRRGELVRLKIGDVDADAGVLHICESKFHKSRWVPLSPSASAELQSYFVARQAAGIDIRPSAALLCTAGARAYTGNGLYEALKRAMVALSICDAAGRCPRVQDFRHSFAVAALLRWYDANADVQTNLPKLALYMGHVSIVSTAYYLRWMPAVVERAGERFARSCASILDGGAP